MVTVKLLIEMLSKLPPGTKVMTSGLEGIYPAELGNLFPLKVIQTRFGTHLFIDDGIAYHHAAEQWEPLDQFVYINRGEMQ